MKFRFSNILTVFLAFVVCILQSRAQTYTYALESFEGNTWPTAESGNPINIVSTSGRWTVQRSVVSTTINLSPPTGTKNFYFSGSGYLQTPELSVGAGTLTFMAYTTRRGRTINASLSTNGTDFTNFFETTELSETGWQLITIPIKDVNVKYIRLSNRDVVIDDVLITPFSFNISPDLLSGLDYLSGTGPSTAKSFSISALNLTAGIPITITAPTNFEVSLDGITWGKTATIPNTAGGSLSSKTVYTRLEAGLALGDYSGSLTVSGGGKTVPTPMLISGAVTPGVTPRCISGEFLAPSRGEDFGTFTTEEGRGCASNFFIDPIFQCPTGGISDYRYGILAQSNNAGGWAVTGLDHTVDPPGTYGGMLFVNNGNTAGKVVYRKEWPVCTGANLQLSAWYADGNAHAGGSYPNSPSITFNIYGGNTPGNITNRITTRSETPPLVTSTNTIWRQIIVPFNTATYTYIRLEITNDKNEIDGNDIIIDDIEFKASPLPVEVCITDAKCNGASDGQIEIKRVSGSATFTFVLDGSNTRTGSSATFTGLSAGPHTLKISDGSGACDVVPEVVISQPQKLVATATTDPNCIPGSGPIGILASGGSPGYQYSQGSSGPWSNNSVIKGLSNGSYSIHVKDANGCQTTATTIVKCTLPIKWLNFEGYNKDAVNVLKWAITESNGEYFIIERSLNGIDFEEINMVTTQSSSPTIQYYYYEDTHPLGGTNYYRLKYVEKNGQHNYSTTISVADNFEDFIKIYPNPSHGKFTISISSEIEDCKIDIVDMEGKIVYSNSSIILPASIQVGSLPRGLYIIRFYQNGETVIRKLAIL